MATVAAGTPYEERRSSSGRRPASCAAGRCSDAFIYATFSINLITLGLYIFSYGAVHPERRACSGPCCSRARISCFQTIMYSSLIAAMPRAGGDYVWVSRVIGGGIGFVLAVCGWWFIIWHWVPIYANILESEFFQPLAAIIGWDCGRDLLRRAQGHLHGLRDHGSPGGVLHLARHARLRAATEDLLLRRPARPGHRLRPAALPLEGRVHQRVQLGRAGPVRSERRRVREDDRGRRTTRARTTSRVSRSGRPSCSSR